jgi:UDP-N-acetylmuramoyl-tripeptide--D-alanyl-D-alanine ligase
MAELGEHTKSAHAEIGAKAAEMGLSQLFAVGKWAQVTADAARAKGMNGVSICPDADAVIVEVKEFVRPGDLLLIKASRAAGLERVGAALRTVK